MLAQSTLAVRHFTGSLRPVRARARHAFTALAFHVAGEIEMEHGGRLALRRGDFHVIPAGHEHRLLRAENAELWGIGIATERLDRDRYAEVLAPIESIARGALPTVAVPAARHAFVASIFEELASSASLSPLRHESLVALLLAELAEHAGPALPELRAQVGDLAARAVGFIAGRALGPLALDDVAQALGKNRSHVAEVVRRATGRTVGQLITELRLDEARRRLLETDELVEVIGERVGYVDATHFARMFKRHHGVTPRAWRLRQRER